MEFLGHTEGLVLPKGGIGGRGKGGGIMRYGKKRRRKGGGREKTVKKTTRSVKLATTLSIPPQIRS